MMQVLGGQPMMQVLGGQPMMQVLGGQPMMQVLGGQPMIQVLSNDAGTGWTANDADTGWTANDAGTEWTADARDYHKAQAAIIHHLVRLPQTAWRKSLGDSLELGGRKTTTGKLILALRARQCLSAIVTTSPARNSTIENGGT